ncbi:GtrA family protein [Acetobacter aceti]|uniref:GtrA family protein n=1 Tax=Acetobacter aceti TaxID=435 RepID=UPI0009DA8021
MQKFISYRFFKFFVCGVLSTLLYVISSFYLYKLHVDQEISSCLSVLSSGLFSYIVNTTWTFNDRMSKKSFFKFYVVTFFTSILSSVEVYFAKTLNANYWECIGLVVITMPLLSFSIHRLWTYSHQTTQCDLLS